MPKKKAANPFAGRYRITVMEIYDPEYLDAEVEAFMRFDKKGLGDFQFGYPQGEMDCHYSERDGQPLVEFTWSGMDEMDLASGRGWAVMQGKDLAGEIYTYGRRHGVQGSAEALGPVKYIANQSCKEVRNAEEESCRSQTCAKKGR